MAKLKRFALDSLSSYFNMAMKMVIYFIALPVYIDIYGKELYGIFLLTFGMATSFLFFDFGISTSLIRYAAAYKRDRNIKQFSEEFAFSISTLFYSIVLVSIIFVFFIVFGNNIFSIPSIYHDTAAYLFLISIPFTISIFLLNFTKFLTNGLGHFFKRNMLQTINVFITISILLLVYFFKINILYFAILSMLPNLLGIAIDIFYLRRHESELISKLSYKINLKWNYVFKSKYSKFNLNIFKNSVAGFFSREIDKPLIAFFLGTNSLVGFSILIQPFSISKGLIANVFFVIQQKLQQNINNKERIRAMILAFSRGNFILVFLLIMIIYVAYPGFVRLWMPNEDFQFEANWAFIAIFNLLLIGFYKAQYSLLSLSDDNIKTVKLSLISIAINLVVSVSLINFIGILAVVLGTTIQAIYNFSYFYFFSKKTYNITLKEYLNIDLAIISIIVVFVAVYLRDQFFFIENNWFNFFIKISIFIFPILVLYGYLFKKEIKLLKSL